MADLTELYIGAGGWAYFHLPGISSLTAYSKAFNFVEVNSTFYEIPDLKEVDRWKKTVPPSFRFSVRAHRSVTHNQFEPSQVPYDSFKKMLNICSSLDADALHLQFPASVKPSEGASKLEALVSAEKMGRVKLVVEVRGENGAPARLPPEMVKVMRDYKIVHCVDLLKMEVPAYNSDILYSRIFGKGRHNIYQPEDSELLMIDEASRSYGRAYIAFHGARMYSDAARLRVFRNTGKFPMVTGITGIKSLEAVLKEDAVFPVSKEALIKDQGWKLFDAEEERRIKVGEPLSKLPDKMYGSVSEVIVELKKIGEVFG